MNAMEDRLQEPANVAHVMKMDNGTLRTSTDVGRLFGHYAGFDAMADSIRSIAGRIYLPRALEFPGESIESLVGEVTKKRSPAGGRTESPRDLIHLWDKRPDGQWAGGFEGGKYVSAWCDPPAKVRRTMDVAEFGSWGVEIIHRTGSEEAPASDLLVSHWSSIIGGRWLTLALVCENCGQYQHGGDCLNDCLKRGFTAS